MMTKVLTGPGGAGKTQLAAAAFRRAVGQDTDVCVWVTAISRDSIISAFLQARAEVIPRHQDNPDPETGALEFVAWLASTTRRWLVVLDDISDPQDLHGLWPSGPAGTVLATTRRRDIVLSGYGHAMIDVGTFTPREAASYFSARLVGARPNVLQGAPDLAADLGYHPLAMAQAAAVILAEDGLNCQNYRQRLNDPGNPLSDILPPIPGDAPARTVALTWLMALERANAQRPAGLAKPILEIASMLDANGVPRQVFSSWPCRDYAATVLWRSGAAPGTEVSEDEVEAALLSLELFSLINQTAEEEPALVRVHALAQRATRESLGPVQLDEAAHAAAGALNRSWPELCGPELNRLFRANVEALVAHDPPSLWRGGAHPVLVRTAESLMQVGMSRESIVHATDLAARATSRLGEQHRSTLEIRLNLARYRAQAGYFDHAQQDLRYLELRLKSAFPPRHTSILQFRHFSALLKFQTEGPHVAESDLMALLPDIASQLGNDHLLTFSTCILIASLRAVRGDFISAVQLYDLIAADLEETFGESHPLIAVVRSSSDYLRGYASPLTEQGAREHRQSLERLLDEQTAQLGENNPLTLQSRLLMATAERQAGHPEAGLARLERLIPDVEQYSGSTSRLTMSAHLELIETLAKVRGPQPALDHGRQILTQFESGGSRDAFAQRLIRGAIARCTADVGDVVGAQKLFEQLIREHAAAAEPDDLTLLNTRFEAAELPARAGNTLVTVRLLEKLLSDMDRHLGPDHHLAIEVREAISHWTTQDRNPII